MNDRLKTLTSVAAVVAAAIAIHFVTYTAPVKMALVCDGQENCVDLYGKPSIGISMGASHFWGFGRAEDPAGHCRNGCTVKVVYDQVGDLHMTQADSSERPPYPYPGLPKSGHQ